MKKLIISFVLFSLISNFAFGSCDWSTIKQLPDGGFEYSPALNICVGNLVQSNQVQTQQIADLTKALTLKDLALKDSDTRATLWNNTSSQLEARLQKVDSLEKTNEWLYFALGALTVIGTGFAVAQLTHH